MSETRSTSETSPISLRAGSRGSKLALTQTRFILSALQKLIPHLQSSIEVIRTKGDIISDVPLSQVGDQGLFIKEIETALLEDRVDFAVHSMQDVPSLIPSGLVLAVTTRRLDPRDVLISRGPRSLTEIPRNGTVATGSLRRRSQILAVRPDLVVQELRGNVTTRLNKFDSSSWDAIVLAGAGLERLGLSHRISAYIPTTEMLPAVGQGALALEARAADTRVLECLAQLQHHDSAVAVEGERSFLQRLEGGCQVPLGALGLVEGRRLSLEGFLGTVDGRLKIRRRIEGPVSEATSTGLALAEQMLNEGGKEILEETRSLPGSGSPAGEKL